MTLTKYLEYIKESKILQDSSSISAGELLNGYLTEHIPLKYEKEHSLDSNAPVIRKLKYCLNVFIPEIAAYMVSNHTRSISTTEMGICLNKDQSPMTIDWNIEDLIGNYIVPCNLMYCTEQSESNKYFFVHEIYQDYFTAFWWVNKTKQAELAEELLQFSLGVQVKRYIGDILNENRYKNKSDIKSEPSPVERILRKNRGIFNNIAVQKFNANCVEIMKICRHNSITADYSELDLCLCQFTNSNCQNSNFKNSVVKSTTFIADLADSNHHFSHGFGLRTIWTNGELLVRVYIDGDIIATNILDGSLIYHTLDSESRCSDGYIDEKRIILDYMFEIREYDTMSGELLEKREAVSLCKDEEGFGKGLIKCLAKINRWQKNIKTKGKIYVLENHFPDKGYVVYDNKNDYYYVIEENLIEVFDNSFSRVGILEVNSFFGYGLRIWDVCQKGWFIGGDGNSQEIIFHQIKKDPLSISKTISASVDLENLWLVYISNNETSAVVLDKNLNVTSIDLITGSYTTHTIPQFKPGNCNITSFCADDDYICFYYYGTDYYHKNNDIEGICFYNYHNKMYQFKTISLGITYDGVYIMSGNYGFVVYYDESIHLINRSLVEISVVTENRRGISNIVALGNQFICYYESDSISYLCSTSNGCTSISFNNNNSKTIESYKSIDDFYIATEDYLIHKSGTKFINCSLIHHFTECSCDIVKSTISNHYAIIKYNLDSPDPNIEVLIIENDRTLNTKKTIILHNHNDNNVYDLFSRIDTRSDNGDSKSEIIEDLNPHILFDSFQFVHGNLYCFFDNLYYTSLVKIDITNALVNTVFDLKGRYAQNFVVNEEYIISYCSESPFVEPYTSEEGNLVIDIPTCSIDTEIGVSLLKSGEHFNIDLSKVSGNYPDETITGGIDQYAFSSESNMLAVKQYGTNTIFFYKFSNTDDNVRFEFIKKVDIIATANYQGCDFNGVNLDDKTIQCLIDNGGHI